MSVVPGSAIGPYTIDREIGRGGMGVVFLARDARLERDVAIKALPEEMAHDPKRLERFEREARSLARLNHPNIAAIYGFEEHEGHHYLIMEHVEGTTLGEQLNAGPLPVDVALDYAAQIAAGVEAAHDSGVIHRDLKPENIRVTPDGQIKVLDFGLARAAESGSSTLITSQSPTVSPGHSPTLPGVILGTAPYMSPEQARGRRVDKRTDIWSFGVILYEMLTGAGPFLGETVTDSIAAVLHKDVDLDALPPDAAASVRHVLGLCLQRDPAARLHDVADARLLLQSGIAEPAEAPARSRSGLQTTVTALLIVTTLLAIGSLIRSGIRPAPADRMPIAFTLDLPEGASVNQAMNMNELALSPEGDTIAFVVMEAEGDSSLYIRRLDEPNAHRVDGLHVPRGPAFSPDGEWLAIVENGERITRIPVDGGPGQLVVDLTSTPGFTDNGMLWRTPNEIIVCADYGFAMRRINVASGEMSLVRMHDPDAGILGLATPTTAPNPGGILISSWTGPRRRDNNVSWLDLETTEVSILLNNASMGQAVGDRWLTFVRDGSIYATEFDFDRMQPIGEARPVIPGVATTEWSSNANACIASTGVVIYEPGDRRGKGRRLVYLDAEGSVTPAIDRVAPFVRAPDITPDGRLIAYTTLEDQMELWIHDVQTGAAERHRIDGEIYGLRFAPTSDAVYFMRVLDGTPGVWRLNLATEALEPIAAEENAAPKDWTSEGKILAEARNSAPERRDWDIVTIDVESGERTTIVGMPHHEWDAALSHDKEWLAYCSFVGGQTVVQLRRFPDGRDWIVAAEADTPTWSSDSKTLFYLSHDGPPSLVSRTIDIVGDRPELGPEQTLVDELALTGFSQLRITPDDRFLVLDLADWEKEPRPLRVVVNWDVELERLFSRD